METSCWNLTLTSVVFESLMLKKKLSFYPYLTLTSVVFEFKIAIIIGLGIIFNFNKCCIWIEYGKACLIYHRIFNFNKCCIWIAPGVFKKRYNARFNFNKCCIWIEK